MIECKMEADLFPEDSRISKQLRRLSREDNAERFLEMIQQLEDTVVMSENIKYVRRNADHILDGLFDHLQDLVNGRLRGCIGQVGHIMDNDSERFVNTCFSKIEHWRHTELKVLALRGLYHFLELDITGHHLSMVGDSLVERLHSLLEATETVEVMVATVDIFRKIHAVSPSIISSFFEDIVDILVGWHIDYSQPADVTSYVSLSLQSFTELWLRNLTFANTLLSQFIEDMEDYMEESANEESDPSEDDYGFDSSCNIKKVAAFIGVYTTTLRCIGNQADPSLNPSLPASFHISSLRKMIGGAEKLLKNQHEDSILNALNQLSIVLLPFNLKGLLEQILILINMHQNCVKQMNFSAQLSFLYLLKQTIQQLGSTIPMHLVQHLFSVNSPLKELRMSPQQEVWKQALSVYHSFLRR
ncbi:Serine/threonine-protein kinase SMG1 [Armadillidium nasatum]|uniref:Serine/threonine-protein kinase SMG1 n=1 Tax=Armadillidium nasatum TaxID=96803 RepID=A0A5N5SKM3_9CRUS|nr:Serine/threonine-protein kinase SMG1 [Armadillidium nasatum]